MGKSSLPKRALGLTVCAHPQKPPPNHKQVINVRQNLFMLPLDNHRCINSSIPLIDFLLLLFLI
jgi:hypothetical protein